MTLDSSTREVLWNINIDIITSSLIKHIVIYFQNRNSPPPNFSLRMIFFLFFLKFSVSSMWEKRKRKEKQRSGGGYTNVS